MRKAFALCVGKRIGVHQVREEEMAIPGKRTCTYKGMKAFGIFRDRQEVKYRWNVGLEWGRRREETTEV